MSDIIIPENGKETGEKPKVTEQLLFRAIMKEGQINISIGVDTQLRDISHALRILGLMLDSKISIQQMQKNTSAIKPISGIIGNLRRGFIR